MTKKDYIAFANKLYNTFENNLMHDAIGGKGADTKYHIIYCNAVADIFAADNPRFDREKFLKACGAK
jgi:hypothetical protein